MTTTHAVLYTLSLHDALPISPTPWSGPSPASCSAIRPPPTSPRPTPRSPTSPPKSRPRATAASAPTRSEEHTSELQSLRHLVCRLLLEKKNQIGNKQSEKLRL